MRGSICQNGLIGYMTWLLLVFVAFSLSTTSAVDILVNAGPFSGAVNGTRSTSYSGSIANVPLGERAATFRTARIGRDFTYHFDVPTGGYTLTIGVAETSFRHCKLAKSQTPPVGVRKERRRLFSIMVNGRVLVSQLNVAARFGCFSAGLLNIPAIHNARDGFLAVRFKGDLGSARVSFIRIRATTTTRPACVPDSPTGRLSADHSAHSVPGSYPPQNRPNSPPAYVDADNDNAVRIYIDGSQSHTHYFDPGRDVIGRLVDVTWSLLPSNTVISKKLSFWYTFPVGNTRLRLTVQDNACDVHSAETTVSVFNHMRSGIYCYYYPDRTSLPATTQLTANGIAPAFAAVSRSLNPNFRALPIVNNLFVTRCRFKLRHQGGMARISVDTKGSGSAKVFMSGKEVFNSQLRSPGQAVLKSGLNSLEVVYSRTTVTKTAGMAFKVDGKISRPRRIVYDVRDILPTLIAVLPGEGRLNGGARVRLTGTGLYAPLVVLFDGKEITPEPWDGSTESVVFITPPSNTRRSVSVSVRTKNGLSSNALSFQYDNGQCDGPAFSPDELFLKKAGNGRDVIDFIGQPACVAIGPDHRLYMGTLKGSVAVIGYNADTLRATTYCTSALLTDPAFRASNGEPASRNVLGIAFNPQHGDTILPYISTSTPNWWKQDLIARSNSAAWRNGAVERLRVVANPGSFPIERRGGICLGVDRRIVTGLPVANGGSHAINSLEFTQDGDLLIAVGGMTNMGLPGVVMGNVWESPLSGALLIAKLSKGFDKFDGAIRYANGDKPYTARVIGGDVSVYASGLRNMFTMTLTRDGVLYGVDQGPGCPLGGPATSCEEFNRRAADRWPIDSEKDWPSRVRGDETLCSGLRREDKVLNLKSGKFYGHANLQRGECAWIDPLTGRTANGKNAPTNYEAPLTILPASVTSVREYGASHFCNAMRGDLVLSTYRGVTTWRLGVQNGGVRGEAEMLGATGGTSFAEDAHGNLIFPRLTKRTVMVLRPRITTPSSVSISGVWPRRHPRRGGSSLLIAGFNFGAKVNVRIGKANCPVTSVSTREIWCRMPSQADAGSNIVPVLVFSGEKRNLLKKAVVYMAK